MTMRKKSIQMLPFADSLKLEGRFDQAKAIYLRELALRTKLLGEDSLAVAATRLCIAELYKTTTEALRDGKTEFGHAIRILENEIGRKHIGKSLFCFFTYFTKETAKAFECYASLLVLPEELDE